MKLESKRTIELSQFVPLGDVDPRYFEQPYYVTPGDDYAAEGYLVIREALKKPAIQQRLQQLGAVNVASSPQEYREWLKKDHARWSQLIKLAHIKE